MEIYWKKEGKGYRKTNEENAEFCMVEINEYMKLKESMKEMLDLNAKNKALVIQNQNFIRIMRERANAKRKLVPKKGHNGYLIMFSRQYKEKYVVENPLNNMLDILDDSFNKEITKKKYVTMDAWMTKLQTYYDVTLKMSQVKGMIIEDLKKFVFPDLGIKWIDIGGNPGNNQGCGVYKMNFEANYRAGLWEVIIFHTKELSVPREYKPKMY